MSVVCFVPGSQFDLELQHPYLKVYTPKEMCIHPRTMYNTSLAIKLFTVKFKMTHFLVETHACQQPA